MTICLKTSSAGSASEGFSDIHAETARMSGITNRVLRPVPDAEARRPIRGRHNLRYAREKPWVETRGFSLAGGWVAGWVRCRGTGDEALFQHLLRQLFSSVIIDFIV